MPYKVERENISFVTFFFSFKINRVVAFEILIYIYIYICRERERERERERALLIAV